MSTIDQVLGEFVDAWNTGRRPRVDDYLARVPAPERDALADALMDWLAVAPAPAYSEEARAAIRAEPAVAGLLAASGAGLWPSVLPRLRARAGLAVRDLAERLVAAFGLGGQEQRAAGYLERMERGELDAARVSRRLLDVLGATLGVSGQELAEAGDLGRGLPPPAAAAAAAPMRLRARAVAADFGAVAGAAEQPPPDELDRLFTGGRDA